MEKLFDNELMLKDMMLSDIVGWIKPDGEIVKTQLYDHLSVLFTAFPDLAVEQDQLEERLRGESDEYVSDLGPDDHPAWHVFSNYEDGKKTNFRKRFMRGHIRQGGCVLERTVTVVSIVNSKMKTEK